MRTWSLRAGIAVAVLLACGCFREVKDETMPDAVSYLTFQGSGAAVSLVVDGTSIAANVVLQPSDGVRYQVTPGRHTIEVRRGGAVVVNRQIYVGEGETFAVSVPGT
jgi:hypothetical protein